MTVSLTMRLSDSLLHDRELVDLYGRTERELGGLGGFLSTFEEPLLFHPLLVRLESLLLARLMGSEPPLLPLFLAEHSPGMVEPSLEPAFRNVATFLAMFDTLDRELPVDITFLIDLYQARGGKTGLSAAKVFRQPGGRGGGNTPFLPCNPASTPYTPPSPGKLGPGLFALEKFLRKEASFPGLVMGALAFYQMHLLRPFQRHNVELAGIVLSALLFRDGAAPFPFFTLSGSLLTNPDRFERAFCSLRDGDEAKPWVAFVLEGIMTQVESAGRLIRSLLQIREEYVRDLLSTFGPVGGEGVIKLAGDLVTAPVLTVGGAAKTLRVTFRSAQMAVDKMLDVGIVEEVTGRKRNRLYVARQVMATLEERLPKR